MATLEKISIREYARRIGVSETAVRKAIKKGKILRGYDPSDKKIIPTLADKEYGSLSSVDAAQSSISLPKEGIGKVSLNKDMPYAEIRKAKELVQTKLLALELQREEGKLVNKEAVYKELFDFGRTIRTSLLQIPDRCIDDILRAPNRHEGYNILLNAITEVLTQLSDTSSLKL